jgi:FeS assembly SUF system protein
MTSETEKMAAIPITGSDKAPTSSDLEESSAPDQEQASPPASSDTNRTGSGDPDAIRDEVIARLKTVFDPEIPVNIYELGLIYKVDVAADGATQVTMTLTTPMCPAAEELPPEVETKAREVPGVTSVQLDLVWDPPWTPDMMSDAAKLDLGMG